jgi:DNA-directed RNA polymerase subunit RPC12/RpoP
MAHDFAYPRVAEFSPMDAERHRSAISGPDREMRCPLCTVRMFSSRAAEFVLAGYLCPRCQHPLELVGSAGDEPLGITP